MRIEIATYSSDVCLEVERVSRCKMRRIHKGMPAQRASTFSAHHIDSLLTRCKVENWLLWMDFPGEHTMAISVASLIPMEMMDGNIWPKCRD